MNIEDKLYSIEELEKDPDALRSAIWKLLECVDELNRRLKVIEHKCRNVATDPLAWPPQRSQ